SPAELLIGRVAVDHAHQIGVDAARRADDVAALEPAVATGEVADYAAGLGDHQRAGGNVPRREMELEEAVENAVRGVGQVERRGARPPHALRYGNHVFKY